MSKENINSGFYKHEKFGDVPNGWDVTSVKECFDFFPVATYSRSVLSESGDCAYVHYGDIHTKFNRFIDLENDELPYVTADLARRFTKIEEGDLVIADASEDYEGVGKAVEVVNVRDKQIISGLHTLHLRTKDDCFVNGFKGYLLNQEKVRLSILRSATGIKVYSISKSGLKKILLPKPPKPEQIAITAILSKVDEAILNIEKSIKAAEKLKKGFIQNMLTGKLKPDGTWRKDEDFYTVDKYGKIPKGWIVKPLKDISEIKRGRFSHRPRNDERFYNGKFPFIQTSDIVNSTFYLKEHSQTLSTLGTKVSKKFEAGTIIITIAANIGDVALAKYDVYFPDSLIGIMSDSRLLYNKFLLLYLMTKKTQLNQLATESAQKNINYSSLRPLPVILPRDLNEQKEITSRIEEIFTIISEKKYKIQRYQDLKKALMQNLLSGKVRLSPDIIAELNITLKETYIII